MIDPVIFFMLSYVSFGVKKMKKNKKRVLLTLASLCMLSSLSIRPVKYKKFNSALFNDVSFEKSFDDKQLTYFEDVIKPYQEKVAILNESINIYSNVYLFDEEKLTNVLREKTDLFKMEKLLTMSEKEIRRDSLLVVKDIYKHPANYDIDINTIASDKPYEKTMTIRETVKYYSELFDLEPEFVMAIECWESHYYDCPIATRHFNPGALVSSKFANLEQGIIGHVTVLRYNYFDKGRDTFAEIEKIYTEDKGHWLKNVTSIYNSIKNDKIALYDEKELALVNKK